MCTVPYNMYSTVLCVQFCMVLCLQQNLVLASSSNADSNAFRKLPEVSLTCQTRIRPLPMPTTNGDDATLLEWLWFTVYVYSNVLHMVLKCAMAKHG